MADPKTFTEEQVAQVIASVRWRERMISAMLAAIQRSKAAGDNPEYTNALQDVLNAQLAPQAPAPESKPEEKEPDEKND